MNDNLHAHLNDNALHLDAQRLECAAELVKSLKEKPTICFGFLFKYLLPIDVTSTSLEYDSCTEAVVNE